MRTIQIQSIQMLDDFIDAMHKHISVNGYQGHSFDIKGGFKIGNTIGNFDISIPFNTNDELDINNTISVVNVNEQTMFIDECGLEWTPKIFNDVVIEILEHEYELTCQINITTSIAMQIA